MEKKNYAAVDIAKLFFAYCVIGLHSGALYAKPYGYYLHALIFRLGVPFFFLCAGYFLGRKTTAENRKQVFLAYIKKLLPTYFLWNAFYVPYSLYISNNLSAASLLDGIWRTVTMRSITVMWFVGALIWSVIILLHFADEKKLPLVLAISAAVYVIGLTFNTYNFVFLGTRFEFVIRWLTATFWHNSNAWFCGFYYVAFGYYLSRETPQWLSTQKKRLLVLLISGALLVGEVILVKAHADVAINHEYYLAHLAVIPALFLLLRDIKLPNFNTTKIRNMSSYIYYSHFLVIYAVSWLGNRFSWWGSLSHPSVGIFVITTLGCIAYIYGKELVKKKAKR